jgi:hypothetical protein
MAIGTPNITFADLSFNLLPTIIAHHMADRTTLFSANMIKVEAPRIAFSAIHARMFGEIR